MKKVSSFTLLAVMLASVFTGTVAAQTCTVIPDAINAPLGGGYAYDAINTDGVVINCHGTSSEPCKNLTRYYPISNGMIGRDAWLAATVPEMPVYKPVRDPSVKVISGYVYGGGLDGLLHNAIDYGKDYSAKFPVYAVADGTVIWIGYSPSTGNVVIIEHTSPNGQKWRTLQSHLMNGRENDILLARATKDWFINQGRKWPPVCIDRDDDGCQWMAYQKEADDAPLSDPAIEDKWGLNADTLKVWKGKEVKAGELIGMAGDTGRYSGGIHLHIMFARLATYPGAKGSTISRWTFFDPYGLYSKDIGKDCYGANYPSGKGKNQHRTHYAPHFRDFADLPCNQLQLGFDYFASVGWFPQTLATGKIPAMSPRCVVGGSYRPAPSKPVVRTFRTFDQYQSDFDYWVSFGWRPRTNTTYPDATGTLYSTIYTPIKEAFWTSHKMTESWFNERYLALYKDWELTAMEPYVEGNELYFIGSWEQRAHNGYYMRYRMKKDEFKSTHNFLSRYRYDIKQVNRYYDPVAGESRYSALWSIAGTGSPVTGVPLIDLTAAEMQSWLAAHYTDGYRIRHMSVYGNSYNIVVEK